MAKRVMKTYKLVWSPTGQTIATGIVASTMKAAIGKAPKPYSKYKGEIYAEETGAIASNPRGAVRAKLPLNKKVRVNWVMQNRDGTVTVSVPSLTNPRKRNTEGFKDARGVFHPIRSGDDYEAEVAGERYTYAPAKRKAGKRNPGSSFRPGAGPGGDYKVYLRGKAIATFTGSRANTPSDLKRMLVGNGYGPGIVVKRITKKATR